MNDQNFMYVSSNGTRFMAKRCDFNGGIDVHPSRKLTNCEAMQDAAEMAGYHAANVWPELNGFAGYDCLEFTFHDQK